MDNKRKASLVERKTFHIQVGGALVRACTRLQSREHGRGQVRCRRSQRWGLKVIAMGSLCRAAESRLHSVGSGPQG